MNYARANVNLVTRGEEHTGHQPTAGTGHAIRPRSRAQLVKCGCIQRLATWIAGSNAVHHWVEKRRLSVLARQKEKRQRQERLAACAQVARKTCDWKLARRNWVERSSSMFSWTGMRLVSFGKWLEGFLWFNIQLLQKIWIFRCPKALQFSSPLNTINFSACTLSSRDFPTFHFSFGFFYSMWILLETIDIFQSQNNP